MVVRPLVIVVCLAAGCGSGPSDGAPLDTVDTQTVTDARPMPADVAAAEDMSSVLDAVPAALDAPEDVLTQPDLGREDAFDRIEPDAGEPDAKPVDLVDDMGSDLVEADTFVDVGPELPPVVPLPSLFHVHVDSGRNLNDEPPHAIAPLSDGGLLVSGDGWVARFTEAGTLVWHRLRPRTFGEVTYVWGAAGTGAGLLVVESVRESNSVSGDLNRLVAYSPDGDVLWQKTCAALAGVPCEFAYSDAPLAAIDDQRVAVLTEDEAGRRWLSVDFAGVVLASGTLIKSSSYGTQLIAGSGHVAFLSWLAQGVQAEVFTASGQPVIHHCFEGPAESAVAAFAPDGALAIMVHVDNPSLSLAARVYRIDSAGAAPVKDLAKNEVFRAMVIAPTGDIFTAGRGLGNTPPLAIRTRWSPSWQALEAVEESGMHQFGPMAWQYGALYDSGQHLAFPESPAGQTDVMLRATRWPGQPGVEPASVRVQLTEPLGESELGPRCEEENECFDVCGRPMHLEPIPPALGMSLGPGSTTYAWYRFWPYNPVYIAAGHVVHTGSGFAAWTKPLSSNHSSLETSWMTQQGDMVAISTHGMFAVLDSSSPTTPDLTACVPDHEYDPEHGTNIGIAVTQRFLVTHYGYYDLESPVPAEPMFFNGELLSVAMGRGLLATSDPNSLTVFDFSTEVAPAISESPGLAMSVYWEVADLGVSYATKPGQEIGAIDLASQGFDRYLGVVGECWLDLEPVVPGAGEAMRVDLGTQTRLAAGSLISCPPFEASVMVTPDETGLRRVVQKEYTDEGPPQLLVPGSAPIAVGELWDEFLWVGDQLIRNRFTWKALSVLVRLDPDTGKVIETIEAGRHSLNVAGTDGDRLYVRSGSELHSVGRDEDTLTPLPMPPGFSKPTLLAAPGALYLMEHGTLVRMAVDGTILATAAAEILLLREGDLDFGPDPAGAYATDLGVFMVDELQNIHWYTTETLHHRIAKSSKHFRPRGGHHGRLFGLRSSPGGIYVGSATTLAVFQPVIVDDSTFELDLVADSGQLAMGVRAVTAAPSGEVFWAMESGRTLELLLDPALAPPP